MANRYAGIGTGDHDSRGGFGKPLQDLGPLVAFVFFALACLRSHRHHRGGVKTAQTCPYGV